MIGVEDLRKGVTFELDGEIYRVLEYQHQKLGRGGATIKTKLRNLRTGATVERTFNSGQRVNDVRLESRTVQYLYSDGGMHYFMDTDTFEQPVLTAEALGDAVNYLTEGLVLDLESYEGEPISVELPVTVDLEVVETTPGFKGDTASGGTKPAVLQTGLTIQVPFFIEVGDVVRVDTRTGVYVTRVQD
jgi:elongation factor P